MPETLTRRDPAPTVVRHAGVLGLGTALPPDAVPTVAIAERLGLAEDWIVSRTGVRSRRIAGPEARLSELAAEAGAAALDRAGVAADELDLGKPLCYRIRRAVARAVVDDDGLDPA